MISIQLIICRQNAFYGIHEPSYHLLYPMHICMADYEHRTLKPYRE